MALLHGLLHGPLFEFEGIPYFRAMSNYHYATNAVLQAEKASGRYRAAYIFKQQSILRVYSLQSLLSRQFEDK